MLERSIALLDGLLARGEDAARAKLHLAAKKNAPTAWILSYTGVSNEPRVLRQAWSLAQDGWNVVVAGYEGHSPRPPEWTFIELADRAHSRSIVFHGTMLLQRQAGRLLYRYARRVPALAQLGARIHYFALPTWRQNHKEILRLADAAELKADVVVSHDFHTCPPAATLAEHWGSAFVVDCHEYGRGQYMHNPEWVADGRHFATAIQDDYLARADAVTTVCDGIAALLTAEQRLKRPAVTLRSVPFGQRQQFRPTGAPVTVLYHGLISADRGLEQVIQSVALWQPRFRLLLRGSGEVHVVEDLKRLARECGVTDRVTFEPPVAFDQIVPAANGADVGYFVQGDYSPQKRFSLPNKFFEYIMAGLALCVSDLPEMSRIARQYGLGDIVPVAEPHAIAAVINALSSERIDAMKRASLVAAEQLTWEVEQRIMLDLFADLIRAKRGLDSAPN